MLVFKLFLCTLFSVALADPWGSWFDIEKTLENAQKNVDLQEAKYAANYNQLLGDIEMIRNHTVVPSGSLTLPSFGGLTNLISNAANVTMNHAKETINKVARITSESFNSMSKAITEHGARMLLERFSSFIRYMNLDYVKLPSVKTSFPVMRGFATIEFEASNGTVGKLSSIVPNKTISCILDNSTIVIDMPLTIGEMTVDYDYYKLSGFAMSTSGSVGVHVSSNELLVRLRLVMDFGCAVRLEKVQVKSLNGIEIKFKGLCSGCGVIVEYVSTQIANLMQGVIMNQLQRSLDDTIRTFLGSTPGVCAVLIS